MIQYTRASSAEDLKQILELQKKNLPNGLSEKEKLKDGFVTVHHSFKILKEMNDTCAHTIAKFDDKVIGYALSMTKSFGDKIEVLKPMFDEISKLEKCNNYLVMGQICIDKEYRGKGLFRGLYNFMKTKVCATLFDEIITEIDVKNNRSINAHKAIGFETLKEYMANNQKWRIVSLKV